MNQEDLQRVALALVEIETGAMYIRSVISTRESPVSHRLRPNEQVSNAQIIPALAKIMKETVLLLEKLTEKEI